MLEVGMKVRFDEREWRVVGLNLLSGDVYLERGAHGLDDKGGFAARAVLAKNAGTIQPLSAEEKENDAS